MGEILLYGTVGADIFGDDYFTARDVRAELAPMRGPLTVRLNSGGGIASEGQAIYHALKDYPGAVHVHVDGVAASAGSLIAMAGDTITMRRGAWMLVHDPASLIAQGRGTSDDHLKTAAMLEQIAHGYAEVYAARTGRTLDDVREIMRAETVFTAAEAVEAGFATHYEGSLEAVAAAPFCYRIYANAPADLRRATDADGGTDRELAVMAAIAADCRKFEDRAMETNTATQTAEAVTIAPTMSAAQTNRLHRVAERLGIAREATMSLIERADSFDAALAAITDAHADAVPDMHAHGLTRADAAAHDTRISFRGSWDGGSGLRMKLEDALLARMDRTHEPTKGREYAGLSLARMADVMVRAQGLRPFNDAEAVRMAAHSTSDFPLVLENSLTNLVARQMEQRQPDLVRASHEVRRDDYRDGKSITLSATGMPQEVNEGGEIQFVTAEEKGELLPTLRDFASGFNITNKALTNDRLDLLTDIGSRMVQGAVERLRRILLEPIEANGGDGQLMRDGQTMFHANHGNLATTGSALSVSALAEARTAMRKQRGLNGELYGIEPWALVVPAELETRAQQVVAQIAATTAEEVNPFSGALAVITEPGLTDDQAWYLIANPSRHDGLAHAFLDGQRSPRVESRPGWSTLGMEMRLVWALDAKFIETASWFKNPGDSDDT